ncbi:calcium-binding protein SPEC 2A-like [Convolutriloba macropyga]|uniref:calcium-binding protein SPEC 2A-like n=1 Tax=Convolutriloba macropyga TaxID=536237 RepID=UPI003F51BFC0
MSSIQTQTGEQEEDNINNRNNASKDTLQPVNSGDQSQNRNGGGGDESRKGSRIGINAPAPPHKFVKVTKISKPDQLKLSEAFTTLCEAAPGEDRSRGKVGLQEMKKCIAQLGIAVGDERISKHCEVDEKDGEMKIMNYRAFERCYTDIMRTQPVTPKHVNKFYKQLDCLKQGHVTFEALRTWCFNQDIVLPEDELTMMMNSADENLDGKITEKEFIRLMHQINTLRTPSSKKK